MAKTTRKTESVPAETVKKTAPGRKKAVGAEKVTTRRARTTTTDASTASEASAAGAAAGAPALEPTHDEIALRAWSIYERRGRSHGQAMNDWLQAKSELCRERGLRP
jgi:BRCT domain type II-containing protein